MLNEVIGRVILGESVANAKRARSTVAAIQKAENLYNCLLYD